MKSENQNSSLKISGATVTDNYFDSKGAVRQSKDDGLPLIEDTDDMSYDELRQFRSQRSDFVNSLKSFEAQ